MNQAQHNFNHEHITVLLSEAVEHLVLKKKWCLCGLHLWAGRA